MEMQRSALFVMLVLWHCTVREMAVRNRFAACKVHHLLLSRGRSRVLTGLSVIGAAICIPRNSGSTIEKRASAVRIVAQHCGYGVTLIGVVVPCGCRADFPVREAWKPGSISSGTMPGATSGTNRGRRSI